MRQWHTHLQDVLACWRDLHVSLIRRSEFWMHQCCTPRIECLRVLRTEARKLHARRHKIRKMSPGMALAVCTEIVASAETIQKERSFLFDKLAHLSEGEIGIMHRCWQLEKAPRNQLQREMSEMVWGHASPELRSAATVQWLLAGD